MVSLSACGSKTGSITIPLPLGSPTFIWTEKDSVADIIVDNVWHIPSQLLAELHEFLFNSTSLISIGDYTVPYHLSLLGNSLGKSSLRETWNLLRTKAAEPSWSSLIWNKFISPRMSYLSWCLLHRKTPTDNRVKFRGWSMASKYHNCVSGEESDLYLFFLMQVGPIVLALASQFMWCSTFPPFLLQ